MNVTIKDLCTITEDVLSTVVGLATTPNTTCSPARQTDEWLVGEIRIDGTWRGELRIACGLRLATTIASAFFGEAASPQRLEDATSALLELTNILGGHVNAMMESPSRVSLPRVVPMRALTAGNTAAPELVAAYSCNDEELLVTLRARPTTGGGLQ